MQAAAEEGTVVQGSKDLEETNKHVKCKIINFLQITDPFSKFF